MKNPKAPRKSKRKPDVTDAPERDVTAQARELIKAGNEIARILANPNSFPTTARICALADWQMARDAFKNA